MTDPLLAELRQILGTLVQATNWDAAAPEDRFEGYIFALTLEAAEKEGATVRYENRNGFFNGVCTFRTSPGHIWSDARPYTHAVLSFPNKPDVEVHVGIYLQGRSGVLHEADVVVLPRSEALTCRQNRAEPRAASAILTIECKFYDTPPGIRLGRSFIGLSAEFGRNKAFFVLNQIPGNLGKLFTTHDRHWEQSIYPSSTSDVGRLIGNLQTPFKAYLHG